MPRHIAPELWILSNWKYLWKVLQVCVRIELETNDISCADWCCAKWSTLTPYFGSHPCIYVQELGNPHLNQNWLDLDSSALRSSKETACASTSATFGFQTREEKSSEEMANKIILCFALCVLFHAIDVESRPRKLSYGCLFKQSFIIKVFLVAKAKKLSAFRILEW